jgi:hypothetical protein
MIAIHKSACGSWRLLGFLLFSGVELVLPPPCPADVFPTNTVAGDIFLDIGSMNAKSNLGFGWSNAEKAGKRNYRWITHLEADVRFDIDEVRGARIWIESQPLFLNYTRQVVAVYVNNRFAGEWKFALAPEFAVTSVEVPAKFLREGANTLTFRSGYRVRVGLDNRDLSLCVDRILLRFL